MPSRIVREGILTSERVNSLPPLTELFYRRLMSVVDDFGRFSANPTLLRASCYPLQLDSVKEDSIKKHLAACANAGLIVLFTVAGKAYLEMQDFRQRTRASESRYPSPTESDGCKDGNGKPVGSNTPAISQTNDSHVPDTCPTDDSHVPDECSPYSLFAIRNTETLEDLSSDDADDNEPPDKGPPKPKADRIPYDEIFDLYNEIVANPFGRPLVRVRNDKRKRLIKKIWEIGTETKTLDWWRKFFALATQNEAWMNGRQYKDGFWEGANFDFLLREDNFLKIVE